MHNETTFPHWKRSTVLYSILNTSIFDHEITHGGKWTFHNKVGEWIKLHEVLWAAQVHWQSGRKVL